MKMQFQIAILAILIIISLLWLIPNKTRNYEARFFGYLLLGSALIVVTNILYYLAISNFFDAKIGTIMFIAKLDSMSIVITLFFGFMYVLSKIIPEKRHRNIIFPLASIPLLESFVLLIVDIKVIPGEILSIRGYGAMVLYALVMLNIIGVGTLLVTYRKKFTKWHRYINIIAAITIVVGVIAQLLTNICGILELSILNTVFLLFLAIENPYNKIDNKYDCFRSDCILPCLKRYYANKIDGFAAFIGVQSDISSEETEKDLEMFRKEIINELKTVPEIETFLSVERDIFVICDAPKLFYDFTKDLEEVMLEKKQMLKSHINIKTTIIYAENIHVADDEKILFRHMSIAKQEMLSTFQRHTEYYLDEQIIGFTENEEKTKEIIIDAINNDKIDVFYQPIYSSKEERFSSAEALVRIKRDDGSFLLPRAFIKVAEDTGLIMQMGEKVFEKVCAMLVDPSTRDLQLNTIDINLSSVQCENSKMANNFIKIANKYHINPALINFEITQANFEGIYDKLSKNLKKMHEYGFNVSLDDFGNGESNLNYLLNIPITGVKIDRHVIWDYFDSIRVKETVNQIIKLCHKLSISVVATGVEKISQLDEMAIQGVDYIQGYYFFKPMPLDEFIRFLRPNAFEMDETKKKILKSALKNRTIS